MVPDFSELIKFAVFLVIAAATVGTLAGFIFGKFGLLAGFGFLIIIGILAYAAYRFIVR